VALATQAGPADGEDVSADGIGQAPRRLAQRLGGTRLGALAIGRIVSPLQRELYRRTGGRLSLTGRAPVLLLTTTGRRTGKARTVPLLYLRDGDRLVICNVNPGFERPNPWVGNLRAHPHAEVQIGRGTTSMSARPASDDELDRYWPQLTKVWPAYQAFYDKGGKRSVFVLEPNGPLQHTPGGNDQPGTGPVRRHRASGSRGDLDDRRSRSSATGS
jgi:deazaflavin-dependent oxidoreductase (nitroreductase family)